MSAEAKAQNVETRVDEAVQSYKMPGPLAASFLSHRSFSVRYQHFPSHPALLLDPGTLTTFPHSICSAKTPFPSRRLPPLTVQDQCFRLPIFYWKCI